MSKSPAYQFYPSDFLADGKTAVMSAEQIGVYNLLMYYCWIEGSLPDDMEDLAILARVDVDTFTDHWEKKIQRCFEQNEAGEWVHPRLEKEREKQKSYKEQKKEAGKMGAKARWEKKKKKDKNPPKNGQEMADNGGATSENSGANVSPMAKNASSSSSSSSTTVNNSPSKREREEPSVIMAKRNSTREPISIPPPEDPEAVKEIGNMKGIPPDQCEVYYNLRATDNFMRKDNQGNWKEILNWHADLAHLYSKGALRPKEQSNTRTNGKGNRPNAKKISDGVDQLFEND